MSLVFFVIGVFVVVGGLMRLRKQGLAEPGPNALLSHVVIAGGFVAVIVPVAALISAGQAPVDTGAGVGLWLGLLAGAAMVAVGVIETNARGARGA